MFRIGMGVVLGIAIFYSAALAFVLLLALPGTVLDWLAQLSPSHLSRLDRFALWFSFACAVFIVCVFLVLSII